MASVRTSMSLLLRPAPRLLTYQRRHLAHRAAQSGSRPLPIERRSLSAIQQRRWESRTAVNGAGSSSSSSSKKYGFEEIQELVSHPSEDRILVDTREQSEIATTGRIPGSLHVPIGSAPDAFFLSPDAFEDKFGFQQPEKEKEVIFYCKAGVRSRAAAQLARQAGWDRTGEYAGSWMDWEKRGGEVEK